jgi:hypothetical protein
MEIKFIEYPKEKKNNLKIHKIIMSQTIVKKKKKKNLPKAYNILKL